MNVFWGPQDSQIRDFVLTRNLCAKVWRGLQKGCVLWRVAVGVYCKLYANSILTGIKLDPGPVEAVSILTSILRSVGGIWQVGKEGLKHSIVGWPLTLQGIRDIQEDSLSSTGMPFSSAIAYLISPLDILRRIFRAIDSASRLPPHFPIMFPANYYERLVRTIPVYSLKSQVCHSGQDDQSNIFNILPLDRIWWLFTNFCSTEMPQLGLI
mgnify:CR=1 FL=1